jgi:enamine deaminase RidA (YjgF/YER057c/UK114 family)
MDRRDILAENPVEKRRGYMPGVSVEPDRILFTAGMTGRQPDGTIIAGGMAAQTQRTMERLQAILQYADANFSQVIKQLLYITDMEAHATHGRAVRAAFFGEARPTSTALGCVAWLILPCSSRSTWSSIFLVILPADRCSKSIMWKTMAWIFIRA